LVGGWRGVAPPPPAAPCPLAASKAVAGALGKPESYVAVTIADGADLLFGGSDAPPGATCTRGGGIGDPGVGCGEGRDEDPC